MADDELIDLKHTVDRHDLELDRLVKRIHELEDDIRIIVLSIPSIIVETA
jgi:hypothetical protein